MPLAEQGCTRLLWWSPTVRPKAVTQIQCTNWFGKYQYMLKSQLNTESFTLGFIEVQPERALLSSAHPETSDAQEYPTNTHAFVLADCGRVHTSRPHGDGHLLRVEVRSPVAESIQSPSGSHCVWQELGQHRISKAP